MEENLDKNRGKSFYRHKIGGKIMKYYKKINKNFEIDSYWKELKKIIHMEIYKGLKKN